MKRKISAFATVGLLVTPLSVAATARPASNSSNQFRQELTSKKVDRGSLLSPSPGERGLGNYLIAQTPTPTPPPTPVAKRAEKQAVSKTTSKPQTKKHTSSKGKAKSSGSKKTSQF